MSRAGARARGAPRAASLVALGVGLLLAGLASGCHRAAPRPRVESVRVASTSLADAAEVGLDAAAVEALARRALAEAGFDLGPAQGALRARLEILGLRVRTDEGGRGQRVDLRVELEVTALDGAEAARREGGRGEAVVVAGGPGEAARAALSAAVGEAARGLRIAITADAKPLESLLADLESSDVRVRDHAVQALADRRDARAVPALLRRLHDADPEVVHRAVGALAQIKDPRAVPDLIDLSRGGDSAMTLRLVRIVGDIGGQDAVGWLSTLEQAHPDPRVRAAATEVLAELRGAARR